MTDIRTLGFLLVGAALTYLLGRWIWGVIWYRFLSRVMTTLLLSGVVVVGAALIFAPKATFTQLTRAANFAKGFVAKPSASAVAQTQLQNALLGQGAEGKGGSLLDLLNPFSLAAGMAPHDSPMFTPKPQTEEAQSTQAPHNETKHAHKKIVTTLAE